MSQFNDLVVLELASVLAGPGVGQFFAELGARVIKVENLKTHGDVTRGWKSAGETTDDRSSYFCSVNWGKQSIAVDLSRVEGQALVQKLSAKCQIVIASFKPGDAEKLGVDYETLSRGNPGLIYGQITGYGSNNPRVGFDAIIQAEAGFMSMTGEPGGKSLKMPVALVDILAGHHLKEAILLAMLEHQMTGRGKLVEVSLIDAAVASLANQATNYLIGGRIPGKQGSAHPNIAPYGEIYLTADGYEIMLAVGTDRQFAELISILEIGDTISSMDLSTNVSRVKNRDTLKTVLESAIRNFAAAELMERLETAKIPAGIVRTVPEALEDPALRPMILVADGFRGVRTFAPKANSISSHLEPPPHFGQHTRLILEEMLKMDPSDVKSHFSERIVL